MVRKLDVFFLIDTGPLFVASFLSPIVNGVAVAPVVVLATAVAIAVVVVLVVAAAIVVVLVVAADLVVVVAVRRLFDAKDTQYFFVVKVSSSQTLLLLFL